MKHIIILVSVIAAFCYSCKTSSKPISNLPVTNSSTTQPIVTVNDTVRIANETLEYEIIIIQPGFNAWLNSIARQRGYYSQKFLETRNKLLVTNYNIRVNHPLKYDPDLYINTIDYNNFTNYGYEVNYLLYNYFVFFQLEFNQKLGPFTPRA